MQDKSGRNRSIRISAEIREFIIRVFLRGGINPKLVILSEPVRAKCALAEYWHIKKTQKCKYPGYTHLARTDLVKMTKLGARAGESL